MKKPQLFAGFGALITIFFINKLPVDSPLHGATYANVGIVAGLLLIGLGYYFKRNESKRI